jgi:hypothetical protein
MLRSPKKKISPSYTTEQELLDDAAKGYVDTGMSEKDAKKAAKQTKRTKCNGCGYWYQG